MSPKQRILYREIAKFLLSCARGYVQDDTDDLFFHGFTSDGETLFPLLWRLDLARPWNDPKAAAPKVTDGYDCYWRVIAKPEEVGARLKKIPPGYPQLSELLKALAILDNYYVPFQRTPFLPSPEHAALTNALLDAEYLFGVDNRRVWADRISLEMRDLWSWDDKTRRYRAKIKDPIKEEAFLAYLSLPRSLRTEILRKPNAKTVARLLREYWHDWSWNNTSAPRFKVDKIVRDTAFLKAEYLLVAMFGDEERPKFI